MRQAFGTRASAGLFTAAGCAAVLFWGTSIAVGRLVVDSLGTVTGPMVLNLAAGGIGTLLVLLVPSQRTALRALPPRYWIVCGGLFVVYALAYNLGIGQASGSGQLLLFGVLNYLWPVLTVLFSEAAGGRRPGALTALGAALAAAGTVLALLSRSALPGSGAAPAAAGLLDRPWVYLLGLVCGVSWALYSVLGRRLAGESAARPVPLQFLAAGLVFLALRAVGGPSVDGAARAGGPAPSAAGLAAVAYQAFVVNLLAYSLWDAAMRRGNQGLAAAASFLTPLLSTACVVLLLGARPGWRFWAASLLVVVGAVLCRLGQDRRPRRPTPRRPAP